MVDLSDYGKGSGCARHDYVVDLVERGSLPRIHDQVGNTLARFVPGRMRRETSVIDLGACTGLMCARLSRMGFQRIVGVETSKRNVALFNDIVAPFAPRAEMQRLHINPLEEPEVLPQVVRAARASVCIARRVIPEIIGQYDWSDGSAARAGRALSAQLSLGGVNLIVLQGRVYKENTIHPVPRVEAEVELLSEHYRLQFLDRQVAVLVSRYGV